LDILIKQKILVDIIKENNQNSLKWSPVENIREIEEEDKSANDDTNKFGCHFLEFEQKNFTRHFSPESIDLQNSYESNKFHFDEKKLEEELKSKFDNQSIQSDLIKINIENAPFNNFNNQEDDNYIIAVTGTTFETLWKLRNRFLETKKEDFRLYYETFRKILQNGYIFARMSPEHKTILVECLREEKFTVLMCGDGANDCGALRAADVGVSLSIEEASIAAPFTSNRPDISCLIKLLREGKASLVTSIQTFKYMMMYSLIQFIAVTILLILNSYLTDNQFLASDLFIIFPLALLIARTGAYEKLTANQPNSALISLPIITSILLQTLIQFLTQYGIYVLLTYQKEFKNNCITDEDNVYPCLSNTV